MFVERWDETLLQLAYKPCMVSQEYIYVDYIYAYILASWIKVKAGERKNSYDNH